MLDAHADKIFSLLLREYSININDRAGKWTLVSKAYAFNPNVLSFVPNKDILAAIGKRLGKRILAQKRQDFNVADNIRDKLPDEYVVEIGDQNKEWMVVASRGGQWSKDNNGEGDESNIMSREEWEEGEDKDGDASASVDFFNGGGGAKDKKTENDTVMMNDDDSNCSGASLLSLSDVSDEHASLSMMTVPDCPRAEGEASGGGSAGEREEEQVYHPSSA